MLIEESLHWYHCGWCILPLEPRSQKPALRSWRSYQTKRPTEQTLRHWFNSKDDVGMAVVLGPVSGGLCCRDFDRLDAFEAWAAEHPDLATTLPQSITSRGRHGFLRCLPETIESASPNGRSIVDFGNGELRGGGLAVLPGSVHETGHVYRWQIEPNDRIPLIDDLHAARLAQCWVDTNPQEADGSKASSGGFTDEYRSNGGGLKTTDATDESKCQGSRGTLATNSIDCSLIEVHIEQAFRNTLPATSGRRNKAVFEFARHLKAIDVLRDTDASQLRSLVLKWHQLALPNIQTKSPEETLADFIRAWDKVRIPAGESPLVRLFAEASGSAFPECSRAYETSEMWLLIALCKRLGSFWSPQPFPLACRTAGELLSVSRVTANSWLFLLEVDGIQNLHFKDSQKTRRANRYFYRGD